MDVLFTLAHWHALAKLRLHTESTLSIMESVTTQLGKLLREFQAETCSSFDTRELKRETAARKRRAEEVVSTRKRTARDADGLPLAGDAATDPASTHSVSKAAGKLRRSLNLKTYKDHALGDYVETIRRYGTVDSYSTEVVGHCSFMFFQYLCAFF